MFWGLQCYPRICTAFITSYYAAAVACVIVGKQRLNWTNGHGAQIGMILSCLMYSTYTTNNKHVKLIEKFNALTWPFLRHFQAFALFDFSCDPTYERRTWQKGKGAVEAGSLYLRCQSWVSCGKGFADGWTPRYQGRCCNSQAGPIDRLAESWPLVRSDGGLSARDVLCQQSLFRPLIDRREVPCLQGCQQLESLPANGRLFDWNFGCCKFEY